MIAAGVRDHKKVEWWIVGLLDYWIVGLLEMNGLLEGVNAYREQEIK
jgi:hypothetical protein